MNNLIKEINTDKRVFVIADTHGKKEMLERLLQKIPENSLVIFVGDMIDRGEDSRGVVEISKKYLSVLGNHEDMMINELDDLLKTKFSDIYNNRAMWLGNGGHQTLHSYLKNRENNFVSIVENNIKFYKELDKIQLKKDKKYFESLPIIIKINKEGVEIPLVVSHSNCLTFFKDSKLKEEVNKDYIKEYTLWNRMHAEGEDSGVFNIYGHTIVPSPMHSENYVAIDRGAFLSREGFEVLVAIEYPSLEIIESH